MSRRKTYRLQWRHWLEFTVPGKPVPKARPRFGRNKHTGAPITFSDPKSVRYEDRVAACAYDALAKLGSEGQPDAALRVNVRVYLPRPKSAPARRVKPTVRPDLDNHIKAVLDGCDVLWGDDAQVVSIHASKHYGEPPRVEVEIDVGEAVERGVT